MYSESDQYPENDRAPAVAGRFYPSDKTHLYQDVKEMLANADVLTPPIENNDELLALIVPHAGYVFSGSIAASAFAQVNTTKTDRVFLIGVSHSYSFNGASIFRRGNFVTPLGKITVDENVTDKLYKSDEVFRCLPEAHISEHGLEVQLPFLQYQFGSQLRIVPILLGTTSTETVRKIAGLLKPYLKPGNLFVISTDLSHYPSYNEAIKADHETIDALCKNNPEIFLKQLMLHKKEHIPNLATSMCGWPAALTLLYMTESDGSTHYRPIRYMNSGDSEEYGEKSRVVGYQSVAVIRSSTNPLREDMPAFTPEEKNIMLEIAHRSIGEYYDHNISRKIISDRNITPALQKRIGVFVAVTVKNKLRGCMGRIESNQPLFQTIEEMAVAAAYYDNRFEPITKDELKDVRIEISVMSPLHKINSIDEIVPGRHGILIRKDERSGTYLPDVATKTGWSTLELLNRCSREKAHIGSDGWKTADIFIYETMVVEDET